MNQIITSPEYAPDKFVDREAEVDLVVEKARALAAGRTVDRRVVIFTGGRGVGKSWLLRHLETQLRSIPDLLVHRFNVNEYGELFREAGVPPAPTLVISDILADFGEAIVDQSNDQISTGETLTDMSQSLLQSIKRLKERYGLTLLMDEVYESDWKLLAALEDYLLGPLALEPRVLIVMAGRGRAYPWKTPQLRLKAQLEDLEPFPDVALTTKQLQRQQKKAVSRVAEIHNCSGGNPLANFLLGAYDDPVTALDQAIEVMLETVPAEHRSRIREYLEALCVLRSFDEERIPVMLAAYYNDGRYEKWSYAQARQVREELVQFAFARWNSHQKSYALDEPTRRLMERYLQTAKPETWRRLHAAAQQIYEEWAQDYPRSRGRWQPEAQYHGEKISAAGPA